MKRERFFLPWLQKNSSCWQAILLDIDGTLLSGADAMPGAAALIDWLLQTCKPFLLTTNDAVHSPLEKAQLLQQAGISVPAEAIVSCAHALHSFLRRRKITVAGMVGLLNWGAYLPELENGAWNRAQTLIVNRGIADFDATIAAILHWLDQDSRRSLTFLNDDLWRTQNGRYYPSAGSYLKMLKSLLSSVRMRNRMDVVGKPREMFWQECEHRLKSLYDVNCPRSHIISAGDNFTTDAAGATRRGLQGHWINPSALPEDGFRSIL